VARHQQEQFDIRQEVLDVLLEKVATDRHPSGTMLNTIEQLLRPQDVQKYVEVLMEKVRADTHPSVAMLNRVLALA
jgi:hypothetical protein